MVLLMLLLSCLKKMITEVRLNHNNHEILIIHGANLCLKRIRLQILSKIIIYFYFLLKKWL